MNIYSRALLLATMVLIFASCSKAQVPAANSNRGGGHRVTVQELPGGTNVTKLGYGIALNKGSSLQRKWFVLNDPSCPLQLSGSGINTVYKSSSIGGDYNYLPTGTATSTEPIAAFEVRFLLFDVWGDHMQTLADSDVADRNGQVDLSKDIGSSWRAWENDVSKLLTVVSFVSRVRKPDGSIWQYDPKALLQEVERIKVQLTEKDLTLEKEKPKN